MIRSETDEHYNPEIGDVVTIIGVVGPTPFTWIGSVAVVSPSIASEDAYSLQIEHTTEITWVQRYKEANASPLARRLRPDGFRIRPSSNAERRAAGIHLGFVTAADVPPVSGLTIHDFQAINVRRCIEAFKHSLDSWSLLEWAGALAGEVGEAANIAKKIRRKQLGIGGLYAARDPEVAVLIGQLADEIGDSFAYLMLLASAAGLDAATCAAKKFDKVTLDAKWTGPLLMSGSGSQTTPEPTK